MIARALPVVKQASVAKLIDKEINDGKGIEAIMERFQNSVIVHALNIAGGNVSQAALLLKTHRNNVHRWMRESGISANGDSGWCKE